MKRFKIGLLIAAIALPVVIFLQNLQDSTVQVLFVKLTMPQAIMLAVHLGLGFLAGWVGHSLATKKRLG